MPTMNMPTRLSMNESDSAPLHRVIYGPNSPQSGFEALADDWNRLLKTSNINTIFMTYEWQTLWWEMLGRGELWIIAFHRVDDHTLVGIAPLFLEPYVDDERTGQRHFYIVGCIEVSDYLDLIIARGWELAVYNSLSEWLLCGDAPPWDGIDFCNLPEDSPIYRLLPEIFEAAGCHTQVFQEDVAPQFSLPLRYESYLQEQVDKKQRHEIRRKQRRAEREALIRFEIIGAQDGLSAAELESEVRDFIVLQRASAADKEAFMTAEMQKFFVALAHKMYAAGYLRLCFLTIDGEKAATLFAFEYERHFLLYNSGYDPDAYAQLSPGWALLAYCIQYAIAVGCTKFDFMQGDEEYKYRFGGQEYKVMRAIIRRDAPRS